MHVAAKTLWWHRRRQRRAIRDDMHISCSCTCRRCSNTRKAMRRRCRHCKRREACSLARRCRSSACCLCRARFLPSLPRTSRCMPRARVVCSSLSLTTTWWLRRTRERHCRHRARWDVTFRRYWAHNFFRIRWAASLRHSAWMRIAAAVCLLNSSIRRRRRAE